MKAEKWKQSNTNVIRIPEEEKYNKTITNI